MARQIIKQPDGRYAVWSTIVDNFILIDATPQEIVDIWADEEKMRIEIRVFEIVKELDKNGKSYHQFTKSWDDALETIKALHGKNVTLESLRASADEEI